MPTGYTADLTPDTPFEEFALRCARAFGALIEMRDDPLDAPIPDEFKPSDYHVKALDAARLRQTAVAEMTLEQAAAEVEAANIKTLASRAEAMERWTALRSGYERMITLTEAYQPPSPDHHNFKAFMLEQLRSSLEWDCHEKTIDEYYKLFAGTPAEWREYEREKAAHDVAYHAKHLAEDQERATGRTRWVRLLRESLKK